MYLCEEYMRRHAIDAPYVKHVDNGCVFFKSVHDKNRWILMNLNWKAPTYHPGSYRVQLLKPVRDGYQHHILFETVDDRKIFIEEYEEYFLDWRNSVHDVAKGKREIKLAAWEICLCCYDSLLAKFAPRYDFLQTIDNDLPIAKRIAALDDVIKDLLQEYDTFAHVWNRDVDRYLKTYSHWLSNLIKKNA